MFKSKQLGTLLTILTFTLTAGCGGSGGLQPSSPLSSNQNVTVNSGSTSVGLHPLVAGDRELLHPTSYTITDLGTLGGTFSIAVALSNPGAVSGVSNLPGDTVQHAFLWQSGQITDLGTLGGPNSFANGPPNNRGAVAVSAETSTTDPLGENFCNDISFSSHLICLPTVWLNGVKTRLPTLGGYNGVAIWVNNRGQTVGAAENTTPDTTCLPRNVLQFKAVLWENGRIQELPTFGADSDGEALSINDNGQVVAVSGHCIDGRHAYLWSRGTVTNLGNLGGTMNNVPQEINNRAQVVGFSNLPGDVVQHAFLWENGVIADLGTLPGDQASDAYSINEKAQVVGDSINADPNVLPRAYLWQHNVMTDLNTLIPATSPLYLLAATGINDSGAIAGIGLTDTGEVHPFLAIPSNGSIQGQRSRTSSARLSPRLRNFLREYGHRRMKFLTSTQ